MFDGIVVEVIEVDVVGLLVETSIDASMCYVLLGVDHETTQEAKRRVSAACTLASAAGMTEAEIEMVVLGAAEALLG